MNTELILTFPETESGDRVTRQTLNALAMRLGLSEVATVHFAIRRLAREMVSGADPATGAEAAPWYEPDDGPLSEEYVKWLVEYARPLLPKGRRLSRQSLFDNLPASDDQPNDKDGNKD
jgi:hypothetical protein